MIQPRTLPHLRALSALIPRHSHLPTAATDPPDPPLPSPLRRDANASVTKYLSELLRWGRKYEERDDFDERRQLVAAAFAEFGAALVGNLIQATLFCVASFMIPDIGEVFMEALLTDRPVRTTGLLTHRRAVRTAGVLTARW